MSQRLVDAVHRLQTPLTSFPSIDLSQLWPVRQKLIKPAKSAQNMSFSHTNYKTQNKFTQSPNVNPFSVGRHFNLTRLVWVKANKLFLFDFVTVMLQQERCWVSKNWG